jgi:hypothetical protein
MRSFSARSSFVSIFLFVVAAGCGAGGGGTGAGGAGGSNNTGGSSVGGSTAGGGATGTAGSGGVATYTPPPVPPGGMDACAAFAKATCAKRDACTTGTVKGTTIIFGGPSQCEARELPKCLATLTARGTNKTPALLSACTASLPQQSCPDYFDNILTTACRPVAGTLANGAPCLSSWQCTSSFCSLPHADVCGVCAARPKAGDPCADSVCGTGLLCHMSTLLCETAVADGGACDKNNPCTSGFACVGNGATAKGVCSAEGRTAGTPCDPKSATLAGCDKNAGLFCDATSMQCKAMASATDGQPCGKVAGVETECVAGALCAGASAIQPGTCKAPVADGVACNAVTGPPCVSPAKCVKAICKLPDAAVCF